MQDHEMYYANQSWTRIGALQEDDRKLVLLFPVGSTEPHGPHAPLCTDPLISLGMCRRAVRRLEHDPEMRALILPSLSYAVTRSTGGFPGAVTVTEDTYHAMMVEICTALITKGHRYIVLVNNHFEPEHVQTLHRCIDTVQAETGVLLGYLDLTRKERARRLIEEFWTLGAHAGRYETDLVLAEAPELVDAAVMRALPPVPINLVTELGKGRKDFREMGLTQAYNGYPAEATAAEGERLYDTLTDMLIEQMRHLIRGTGGRDQPGFYTRMPK